MTNPLSVVVKTIEESTEEGSAMVLSEITKTDCDVIPTGIPKIDEITGIGGIPRGRITEIWGDEAVGKTTLCLHLMRECTRLGFGAAFVDSEHALSLSRLDQIGIDKTKTIISQPSYGEQALEIMEMLIRSQKVALVICDSVAALTPKSEIDKDMGEATMGSQARLMSQAMRKLVAVTAKENVAVVFTNQTRAKLGTFYPEKTTTGGNALKFYASMRIKLVRSGSIEDGKGNRMEGKYKMTIIKNKLAIPYRDVEYRINSSGMYVKEKKE
jgi:recombination protein RecA